MKQFWIYVLATICYGIGWFSLACFYQCENPYLSILLFLLAVTFLGSPALNSWKKYFNKIFNKP